MPDKMSNKRYSEYDRRLGLGLCEWKETDDSPACGENAVASWNRGEGGCSAAELYVCEKHDLILMRRKCNEQ